MEGEKQEFGNIASKHEQAEYSHVTRIDAFASVSEHGHSDRPMRPIVRKHKYN